MYIREADFAEYAKGQVVVDYPNPYVKNVGGIDTNIIPTGETITFRKMSESDVKYYIGWCSEECYEGSVGIGGWFPTSLVCGCICGRYSEATELARHTGWRETNGMFGSKNDAFLASKVRNAAKILEEAGFIVKFE